MLKRPEIGTKEHIILWLAGQPEHELFDWNHESTCACGQYSKTFYGKPLSWVDGRRYLPNLMLLNILAHKAACRHQLAHGGHLVATWGELHKIAVEQWDAIQAVRPGKFGNYEIWERV
jgi:hypothetical protein